MENPEQSDWLTPKSLRCSIQLFIENESWASKHRALILKNGSHEHLFNTRTMPAKCQALHPEEIIREVKQKGAS